MEPRKKQLKILVDAHLAPVFKAACKESGVSMTRELAGYIAKRTGATENPPPHRGPVRTATRKDRRGAIRSVVSALAAIRDAEEAYMGNIPQNLCNGPAHEDAERAVCVMDEAIELLNEAYS